MELKEIPINKIMPYAKQPREFFDKEKIQDLANSIKESGLIQPIVVRPKGDVFEIIVGERRRRALGLLKTEKNIPTIIRDVDDLTAKELSLIENWHRQDLTSTERENMVYDLWKTGKYKSISELARKLGAPQQTINSLINAKDFRDTETSKTRVSTEVIEKTRGLPNEERKEIIKEVEEHIESEGKRGIAPTQVREEVRIRKHLSKIKKAEVEPSKKGMMDLVNEINQEVTQLARFCKPELVEHLSKESAKYIWLHYKTYLKPFFEAIEKRSLGE